MKTSLWLSTMVMGTALLFTACQKEIYYEDISSKPHYDSVTLVRSVFTKNYDRSDNLVWTSNELYSYDETGSSTVVLFRDSSANGLNMYTETFTYDAGKRLSRYETTNTLGYFSQIDFSYASNGAVQKATIMLLNGQLLENTFLHSTVNNNKVITMFDTSMLGGRHTYYRPQVIKYTFNSANQLLRQLESETGPNKTQSNWYRDTFDYKFGYSPESDISNMSINYSFVSNGINTPYTRDSVEFIRANGGTELYDTYQHIYKNMYWFSFSEYVNNSFANSMTHNSFYPHYVYYMRQPMLKLVYHSAVSSPVYSTQFAVDFQNTFNDEGQLIRSIYPKPFGNQDGGKKEIAFEYIRMRK